MHGFVPLPCTYMVCVVFSNVFFSLGSLLVYQYMVCTFLIFTKFELLFLVIKIKSQTLHFGIKHLALSSFTCLGIKHN